MNEHETGQISKNAAEIYEEFFLPALFIDWPAHVLAAAGVQPGDKVLDVACGTGVLAREAAKWVGPSGSVVGVDINGGMLEVARSKSPEITWKAGTAESLPFEPASFDRVVSQFALMFFQDPGKAITEMRRVIRPGGTISVAVWAALKDTPGYAVVSGILNELFGPEAARSIEAPYSLGDPADIKNLFASVGEDSIEIQTIPGKARFPSIEAWIYTDIKGWNLAEVLDDQDYERLRREAPKQLAQFLQPDGTIAFEAPAHIVSFAV